MQLKLPGAPPQKPKTYTASTPPAPEGQSARDAAARLSAELEAALVRELRTAYRHINTSLFGGSLRSPTLELSTAQSWLGRWRSETRTLEIGRDLAVEQPWTLVLEVLKHEMAHQYVDEVLGEPEA
ncbi:MAG: DUF2786 domain-containing protein, partial [Myxococcota bacterium]